VDPELQTLGIQLADVAVRNTASNIADRVSAVRARRKDQETVAELEGIVNELISDKNELVRIAQAFEQELVAQRISSSDVAYITTNLVPVLTQLIQAGVAEGDQAAQVEQTVDLLRPILSVETITVLQLIGFNFRRALGEPLTELVSRLILAHAEAAPTLALEVQALQIRRELAYLEVAQNPDAHARLTSMLGGSE
jgi:hypothetical protein